MYIPFQRNFLDGYSAYEVANYSGVIVHMERAVKNYWEAEQECRALCEGKYENREFMDLYEAIASKWTKLTLSKFVFMNCQNCVKFVINVTWESGWKRRNSVKILRGLTHF